MKLTIERYKGIYARIETDVPNEFILIVFVFIVRAFIGG